MTTTEPGFATFSANLAPGDPSALTADNLDLMTGGPDGNLCVGGRGGRLFRVNSVTGAARVLVTLNTSADPGRLQIRGLAVDAANRRLFVAVHSTVTARAPASLRIVPID